jgi:hypothetical protein
VVSIVESGIVSIVAVKEMKKGAKDDRARICFFTRAWANGGEE